VAHAARLTLPLLAALLAACGQVPAADALRRAMPGLNGGTAAVAPAAVPADGPVLLLLAPRQVALVPVSEAGGRRLWRGEGNIAIATEGPRVVATAGLPHMVMATRFDGADPLEDPRALVGRQAPLRRVVDLSGAARDPAGMRFGLALDCILSGRPEEGLILVEERCTGDGVAFTNRFWAAAGTGAVLRSEQWAGDAIGMLSIRMEGV
jgi:hypothetical protein